MTSGPPPGHPDAFPPPGGHPGGAAPVQQPPGGHPGGHYPGASHPAQQYPGGQYPGQPYPGAPYPGQQYPGQQYPGAPQPGAPMPGPGAWGQPQFRPVHRPGAIPLRPLNLGDLYDGAVRIVRHNLGATVGAALILGMVSGFLPLLLTEVLDISRWFQDVSGDLLLASDLADLTASAIGSVVSSVLGTLVTGMIVMVCRAAAVGRKLSFGEAWAATAGSRLRLLGLTLLTFLVSLVLFVPFAIMIALGLMAENDGDALGLVLLGVLLVLPLTLVLMAFLWVRFYLLATPALVMERIGVFASLQRGWELSRGQFWRLLGIGLLTTMLVGLVAGLIAFPAGLIAGVAEVSSGGDGSGLWVALATAVSTVIASAVTTPFASSVTNLQYLDQRIRKEAYDVELAEDAGLRRD